MIAKENFGLAVLDLRCSVCSTLFGLKDFLCSPHFPAAAQHLVEPQLRELYFRALETADTLRRSLGGLDPPKEETKNPSRECEGLAATTPKATPAEKKEWAKEVDTGVKEEEKPEGEKGKEKKKKKSKKRHRDPKEKSPSDKETKKSRRSRSSGRERARSSGIRREERRQESREAREEPSRKERKTRSEQRSSPRHRGEEARARERERSPILRRSPRRPRSPSGLPPPRSTGRGKCRYQVIGVGGQRFFPRSGITIAKPPPIRAQRKGNSKRCLESSRPGRSFEETGG